MASNNNFFNWVKPYDSEEHEINQGAGHLSDYNGFPLNWKVLTSNFGRLKKQAVYQFTTNNTPYIGEPSRTAITKTATIQQHGQPVFVTGTFNDNQIADGGTIVFNLQDGQVSDNYGAIETALSQETNAQYFEISIRPGQANESWHGDDIHEFTPVSWSTDPSSNLYKGYFNNIRLATYHEFTINKLRPIYSEDTYQEEDTENSYKFKMVYQNKDVKITTGSEVDAIEYFTDTEGVIYMDFNNLNSDELTLESSNSDTVTFQQYYQELLIAGEQAAFKYKFSTTANPDITNNNSAFSLFTTSDSPYYIDHDKMVHFTITIKPYGYKQCLSSITQGSPAWNYDAYVINVYIINCKLDPYLYLGIDKSNDHYTNASNPLTAGSDGTQSMPIWSNMGWDIATSGSTTYVDYNNNE